MKLGIIEAIYKYCIFIEEGQCYVFNVFRTQNKDDTALNSHSRNLACKVKVSLK
jgi:hypothetical protein